MDTPAPNNPESEAKNIDKKIGCWTRFKSIFEDRGFDLEYEYTTHQSRTVPILGENRVDSEGYRRFEEKNAAEKRPSNKSNKSSVSNITVDGELSGVINFYEQFATLGDDFKDDSDLRPRSSVVRNRVSMRPSMVLTNILEEETEGDDIEVVS